VRRCTWCLVLLACNGGRGPHGSDQVRSETGLALVHVGHVVVELDSLTAPPAAAVVFATERTRSPSASPRWVWTRPKGWPGGAAECLNADEPGWMHDDLAGHGAQ
jgi:hypothetical protein